MRLVLDARARALLRRLPRTNVYTALELVLLAALAVQCARLFWVLVTPVGALGAVAAGSAGLFRFADRGAAGFRSVFPAQRRPTTRPWW